MNAHLLPTSIAENRPLETGPKGRRPLAGGFSPRTASEEPTRPEGGTGVAPSATVARLSTIHGLSLLAALALTLFASPAQAWMSYHGREHLGSSGWSEPLTALINHPTRVCGQIGPYGPTSRFHYSGDTAAFNQILAQYGVLPGQPHVLYLEPEAAPSVEGFKEGESHDFDLSINTSGQGFLHLYTLGRIRLEDLKIPEGVKVDVLSPAGLPTDPELRAKLQAEEQRVAAFLAARSAK